MSEKSYYYDSMPFIALINHISKNKLKYNLKNQNSIDMFHEGRYLVKIYKINDLSQEDLSNLFGESKATVAKALRKLEDKGYVKREIDENNRRKYKLKITKKGEELAIFLKNDLKEWEEKVGINELDEETMNKIREIAKKSEEILE